MSGRLIDEVEIGELKRLLRAGITISAPPFQVRVQSDNSVLGESLKRLYGACRIDGDAQAADFVIRVGATSAIRRFVRRDVIALIDTPPPFTRLPYEMAPLMFEQALNWCVATRTFTHLVMHAAVVARDGKALIIPGESGQGKSTLCAALVSRGWRHLSDEFAMIDPETLEITAHPRPISLKNESLEAVTAWGAAPESVMEGTPKGTVGYLPPSMGAIESAGQRAMPAAILFPGYTVDSDPSITKMEKGRAFIILTACSVNYRELGEEGSKAMTRLVSRTPIYRTTYPDTASSVGLVESLGLWD